MVLQAMARQAMALQAATSDPAVLENGDSLVSKVAVLSHFCLDIYISHIKSDTFCFF